MSGWSAFTETTSAPGRPITGHIGCELLSTPSIFIAFLS